MKYAFTSLAFGLGANAFVAREASQCVQLKASGGASGVLGQLGDGQNRIGGGNPTGCYCLGANGGFTDSNGRGCILTPPTTQFQCDVGASPTTGFAINSSGAVTYNGNGKFYACPVNNNGEYNVYSTPAPGQTKCVEISLSSAGSCGAGGASASNTPAPKPSPTPARSQSAVYPASKPSPQPSKPAQSSKPALQPSQPAPQSNTKPVAQPSQPAQQTCPGPVTVTITIPGSAPSAPAASVSPAASPPASAPKPSGTCPADLNGNYQYPHLIVPVDSQNPKQAYGTSYNGKIDSHTCSIFNFDIPASYAGQTCSVVFLFPAQKDLQTSSFTVSGSGNVVFSELTSPATQGTTYANQPSKKGDLGSFGVAPGNSYTVASGACAAGQTVSYEVCAGGNFALNYFQDYNPSPIGLYVRSC